MVLPAAFVFAIALVMIATPAWSESADEPSSLVQKSRPLNSDELWEFVSSETGYDLVDVATRQQGKIVVREGRRILVSWYFNAEVDVAVLTRKGTSCIVILRDQQPTKCIAISEDRFSGTCRFVVQEVRDKRAACLRKTQVR